MEAEAVLYLLEAHLVLDIYHDYHFACLLNKTQAWTTPVDIVFDESLFHPYYEATFVSN